MRNFEKAELGRVSRLGPHHVLDALASVTTGRVFDLDAGRFVGMPQWDGHPRFSLTSFRTPSGSRNDGDIDLLDPARNSDDLRFHTELMITGMHLGTHIDALCHVTLGKEGDTWFGGYGPDHVGDYGPTRGDAASIPPIIVRTAILDLAAIHGSDRLPAGAPVTVHDLERAERTQAPIPIGGAVLIRTGLMTTWPDAAAFDEASGAGITVDAARWLAEERDVVLVGSDTPTVEQVPSQVPTNPHPVHDYLLRQCGVHLLENTWLEDLAEASVHEATLICLPLKIAGATGSMVRPIALT